MNYRAFLLTGGIAIFGSIASASYAQAVSNQLEEVVVTSTKRTETISAIPIAVTAVAGKSLAAGDVRDIAELSTSIPNFKAGNGGYLGEAVTIRGLGSGQERAFEQAVGLYVDGVYFPRSRAYRSAFFDLDRVEVMRGPQAVLQGLNSTAGAVSVVTKKAKPGTPLSLDLAGGGEFEHGGGNMEGAASFSPANWLGVRAAIRYGEDGAYYKNSATGKKENQRTDFAARLTLDAALSSTTDLTVKFDHSDYVDFGSEGEAVGKPSGLASLFPSLNDNGVADWTRTATAGMHQIGYKSGFFKSPTPRITAHNDGVMADLSTKLGGGTLSLNGSYYRSLWDQDIDVDATNATFYDGGQYEQYTQKSVSLEYVSPTGGVVDYIVGGYYQQGDLNFVLPNALGATAFGLPYDIGYTGRFKQTSDLLSVFGSATYHVTSRLRLVAGLRYVDERKQVVVSSDCSWRSLTNFSAVSDAAVGIPVNAIGLCSDAGMQVPGGVHRSRRSTPLMYEGAVQYDVTPDVMAYAKYSTSSKSGGFSAGTEISPKNLEYDDERARGVEVGVKQRLLDNRMTLALTGFYTTFDNLQLKSDISDPVTGQTITVISNAGRSLSEGVELEMRYRIDHSLSMQFSGGYLDGKFDSFPTAPCGVSYTPPPGAKACDFSGKVMPFAAHWTGNAALQWTPDINSSLRGVVEPSVGLSSGYYTDGTLDQNGYQGGWAKFDFRVGIESSDGRWSLSLLGKNVLNTRVIAGYQPPIVLPVVFYEPPRTVSLRFAYHL
jgi:outer membrane receptor protein involved in Fe transport